MAYHGGRLDDGCSRVLRKICVRNSLVLGVGVGLVVGVGVGHSSHSSHSVGAGAGAQVPLDGIVSAGQASQLVLSALAV